MTFCVDEYFYAEMGYRGDLDLPLLTDTQWGDINMISVFVFSHIYDFFLCVSLTNMCIFCVPNVGPMHSEGQPRHMQRARAPNASEIDRVFH